jgi:hypothetical protein
MTEKTVFDARSTEYNLGRQLPFHKVGFVHMMFYRILVLVSLATFAIFLLSLEFTFLSYWIKYLIVLVWVLFIPQIFSFAEGFSMMWSKGIAFGHLNKSYIDTLTVNQKKYALYKVMPYVVLFVWIAALGLFVYEAFL